MESLGAEFLEVVMPDDDGLAGGEGGGGYAKVMSPDFIAKEMELFEAQAREVDVVILTAQIPNRAPPLLYKKYHVAAMKPGSVVVDLAANAAHGRGNCEVTVPGELSTHNGNGGSVTVCGFTDFPSRMARQASLLFGANMAHLLVEMCKPPAAEGGAKPPAAGAADGQAATPPLPAETFNVDWGNNAVRPAVITHGGETTWPPPKSEAPPPPPAPRPPSPPSRSKKAGSEGGLGPLGHGALLVAVAAVLLLLGASGNETTTTAFTVFALAVVAGYFAVWSVTPALHTPLMSYTNAISGVIIIGGMVEVERDLWGAKSVLCALALWLASINIFGGFTITQRMLDMFRLSGDGGGNGNGGNGGSGDKARWKSTYGPLALIFVVAIPALRYGVCGPPPPGIPGMNPGLAMPPAGAACEATLQSAAFLLCALLFLAGLVGLSHPETARAGNAAGMTGMLIAVVASAVTQVADHGAVAALLWLAPGAAIGVYLARTVEMTQMPQLVAGMHSFVGLAATIVGVAKVLENGALAAAATSPAAVAAAADATALCEAFVGVFIGALTFSGSIVACGKLAGRIPSKPMTLPGRHYANLAIIGGCAALSAHAIASVSGAHAAGAHTGAPAAWRACTAELLAMAALSALFGCNLVMSIGGGDMPVVVSMLNSYSGWTTAASGFMLNNNLLLVAGALIGSSGAILSFIMCKAMNRSFANVILGGFGEGSAAAAAGAGGAGGGGGDAEEQGEVTEVGIDAVAELLRGSKRLVITPGYGMAAAQCQHLVAELCSALRDSRRYGCDVRFAIHPVAGRLPGHMNVLLAEANVPYDIVFEMDEINPEFERTDVVLVIGANDTVNPAALTDPASLIYGMPVCEVWRAATVVVLKRGMASGYAGIQNPLFFKENTRMLFGNAKATVGKLLAALQ